MLKRFIPFLIALFLLLPAKADIHLTEKSDYVAEIQQVYKALPQRGNMVDCDVTVVWDNRWPDEYKKSCGLYYGSHIFLRDMYGVGLPFVFSHEYGHHVFFTSFSDEERSEWKHFWKKHKKEMPRDYARGNAEEGFAECYAVTFYQGKIPEMYDYKLPLTKEIDAEVRHFFVTPQKATKNYLKPVIHISTYKVGLKVTVLF